MTKICKSGLVHGKYKTFFWPQQMNLKSLRGLCTGHNVLNSRGRGSVPWFHRPCILCAIVVNILLCTCDAPQRPILPTTNYNFKAKATSRLPALIFPSLFSTVTVINYISHTHFKPAGQTLGELKSDMLSLSAPERLLGNDQSFFFLCYNPVV